MELLLNQGRFVPCEQLRDGRIHVGIAHVEVLGKEADELRIVHVLLSQSSVWLHVQRRLELGVNGAPVPCATIDGRLIIIGRVI